MNEHLVDTLDCRVHLLRLVSWWIIIFKKTEKTLSLAESSLFVSGVEHLCCAQLHIAVCQCPWRPSNPDLAVHLIHFILHFDVHEMLHHVFMLSMPSWAFLGLYQVRSLAGGSGPMISDARRYSINMSLSFAIAYQSV